jgi:DNA-directed RNA polymerase subunit beta'
LLLDVGRDIEEVIYYNSYYITQLPKQYQKYYPSKEKRFISVLDPKKSRSIRHTISRIIKDEILTKLNKNDPDYQIGRDIISLVKEVELSFSFDYVFDYIKKHTGIVYDIGSSAIAYLLTQVNIKNEIAEICKNIKPSSQNFKYLVARLDVLTALNKSNTNPSDMIIEYLPVIPPEARPLIQLPTGNYTASDTNELYRKIIQRNERLAKLIADGSTSVIINNEKQLLQQAVDALFDEKLATKNLAKKQYKSITEILKGKTGLLRQNLLGKRVDFSARSVIVGGPDLKLYQVGVPADILIVLFRPFIISRLTRKIDDNGMSIEPVVSTLREAEEMIINKNVAI